MSGVYPRVVSESKTLDMILAGRSIARYGDGELKMANHNAGIKSQAADRNLSARLREILHDSGDCLVGIPNIHDVLRKTPGTQKAEHWAKYQVHSTMLVDREYCSAFITRPDSAPWIDNADYWTRFESIWRGKDVTVVRGSGKSFTGELLSEWGARTVTEILAPRQHAWAEYDSLLKRIGAPDLAIICLGPTATVMAVDLCARGVHALDLGHAAMFAKKRKRGDPMVVTDEDKAVDKVLA